MSIWLVAGSILVVESIGLTWAWALCRAAAVGDRRVAAAPPTTPRDPLVHLAPVPRDAWRRAASRRAGRG